MIYSDGVTEANDTSGNEFEIEGLAQAVIPSLNQAAGTIIKIVNKALVTYTAGAPPSDDITLIVARRVAA